ncbi:MULTISPECIES: helix-turn-helix domain-containing protein [Paraburkholderia]|uniref:XRE family transcriptional regulator n=2 Tax=Paraburkholderia TaxID=1822464 RepID=A0A4R5L2D3_9BURK|nr:MULTISPECIES: helix-turn-helix transcriptional regulator [Paraburkholderia]TDG02243.1 XRE family transcriptional regulator [Paraburkholderia guartelaensis]
MRTLVKDFGLYVRQLREAHAWSQEQLAEFAGLSRSYVSEVERGTVIASLITLDKLACAFGLTAAALLAPRRPQAARDAAPQTAPGSRDEEVTPEACRL